MLGGAVWLLAGPGGAAAQPAAEPADAPSTAGFYTLRLSSRSFDAPLFGETATGRAYLLVSQAVQDLGTLSFWLERGFAEATQEFGVAWRDIPLGRGRLHVRGGDVVMAPLLPARAAVSGAAVREVFPLQGLQAEYVSGRGQWRLFTGQARRVRRLPGRATPTPILAGVHHLRRIGFNYVGAGLTGIEDPTFVDAGDPRTGVASGTYYRQVTPWVGVLAETHVHLRGGVGARGGARFRFQGGEASATLYGFGAGFPFVFPLYRPGERGVSATVSLPLAEFTSLFTHADYVLATRVEERTDLRAEVGLGHSFGSNRPYVYASYTRNRLAFDDVAGGLLPAAQTADLLALLATRNTSRTLTNLRLEHLIRSAAPSPDETRAALFVRRRLRREAAVVFSGNALRNTAGSRRVSAEASLERPLRRRFRLVAGVGATVRESRVRRTGEGRLRLGLVRRLTRTGLTMRAELGRPFSIGLPRTNVPVVRFAFDLGHRLAWRDLESLQEGIRPVSLAQRYGAVEGHVRFEGEGVGRVTIYVDGEPRAVTDRRGRYRVRRVGPGPVTVRLDVREFEAEYGVVGGPARRLVVAPGRIARADFELAVMRYLQGAIVVCEAGGERPLVGAVLTLTAEAGPARQARTSRLGGFQFAELPPGRYRLTLDPDPALDLPERPGPWLLDLTEDVAGFLIRLGCEE